MSSSEKPSGGGRTRNVSPRTIIAAALGVLLALFAVFNSQTVTVHWIVGTTSVALIVVIAVCGLIGFAVGWLLARRHAAKRNGR